jgi:hypothetical protein
MTSPAAAENWPVRNDRSLLWRAPDFWSPAYSSDATNAWPSDMPAWRSTVTLRNGIGRPAALEP